MCPPPKSAASPCPPSWPGVSGALVGYSQGQLSTGSFEVDTGILLFATAFLGGITSIGGAAVAGAIAPLGFVYRSCSTTTSTSGSGIP